MKVILTCDPGFEDIVVSECREKLNLTGYEEKFAGLQGKVLIELPRFSKKLFKLRSIHHIELLVETARLNSLGQEGLKEIYSILKRIELQKFLHGNRTFRVTTQRVGEHSFTSIDVQKVAGQAIAEKYGLKVDLENFDVNVRVDVFGHDVLVGIQLTKDSLYKRFKRAFNHPAGIKTTLAYCLLQLAEVKRGNSLLDPMCGGGTILLEAADIWKGAVKLIGGDINEKYLEGAKENAKLNGLEKFIQFLQLDARYLDHYFEKDSIDRIVTNPPYGIRMRPKELKNLYRLFLESAYSVLKPSGRIVVLTVRAESFRIIVFRTKKYKILHERVVESGGLFPHVFVLEKL